MTVEAATIEIALISHTNAGKTTLARTLLGRDIGEVRDAPHVTQEATPYPLLATPDEVIALDPRAKDHGDRASCRAALGDGQGALREAMLDETENPEGTGRSARVEGMHVCGKTGTAQVQVTLKSTPSGGGSCARVRIAHTRMSKARARLASASPMRLA